MFKNWDSLPRDNSIPCNWEKERWSGLLKSCCLEKRIPSFAVAKPRQLLLSANLPPAPHGLERGRPMQAGMKSPWLLPHLPRSLTQPAALQLQLSAGGFSFRTLPGCPGRQEAGLRLPQGAVLSRLQFRGRASRQGYSKSQDSRVMSKLLFLKYNIYCLDGLIQNSFSSHSEFGSYYTTEYKEEQKVPKPNL